MPGYKKLSGRGHSIGTHSRLWLGDDHVLLVITSGFSEEYRRFYFTDIQAFIARRTVYGTVINVISGVLCTMFTVLGFTVEPVGGAVLWTLGAICGIVVAINTALGPTCVCHVQTAIARHPVPMLYRMRTARELVERLRPMIAAAQGELPPEKLAEITSSGPVPPVAS